MALFNDMPKVKKNSFTVKEAGELFQKLADKAKDNSTPKQVVDVLLKVAEIVIRILAVV